MVFAFGEYQLCRHLLLISLRSQAPYRSVRGLALFGVVLVPDHLVREDKLFDPMLL
jgi:hypothetical protein